MIQVLGNDDHSSGFCDLCKVPKSTGYQWGKVINQRDAKHSSKGNLLAWRRKPESQWFKSQCWQNLHKVCLFVHLVVKRVFHNLYFMLVSFVWCRFINFLMFIRGWIIQLKRGEGIAKFENLFCKTFCKNFFTFCFDAFEIHCSNFWSIETYKAWQHCSRAKLSIKVGLWNSNAEPNHYILNFRWNCSGR